MDKSYIIIQIVKFLENTLFIRPYLFAILCFIFLHRTILPRKNTPYISINCKICYYKNILEKFQLFNISIAFYFLCQATLASKYFLFVNIYTLIIFRFASFALLVATISFYLYYYIDQIYITYKYNKQFQQYRIRNTN